LKIWYFKIKLNFIRNKKVGTALLYGSHRVDVLNLYSMIVIVEKKPKIQMLINKAQIDSNIFKTLSCIEDMQI